MLLKLKNYLKNRYSLIFFITNIFFLFFSIDLILRPYSFVSFNIFIFIIFSFVLLISFLNIDDKE